LLLLFFSGYFDVRLDHFPVSYYMNLLLSNLTQLIILIALPSNSYYDWRCSASLIIYACCALASLCFRTMIALERCRYMASPLSNCITQTKGFVIVSVLVWVFCFLFVPLIFACRQELSYLIFALLPAPVFTVCLLWTLNTVDVQTSIPDDEKCRNVRLLIALLLQYFVTIFPTVILFMPNQHNSQIYPSLPSYSYLTLFLHSYVIDLLLFVFLCKGFMEKLLMCLC
uniref:G-protein coupled receptors family 1 profile domain-containing protein n=1 Tax=Poecilia formosa TaxID=48698 RepID=A0A087YGH3_POEFO